MSDSTCFGDSGGPNYYIEAVKGEILVAVTSLGDAVCRAFGTNARVDTVEAISFINCVLNASTAANAKTCGY